MADIVVVGSLNIDLVIRSPRFPKPGETIQGEDLATVPGGKGANQAVAAARLGANVSMIGCVGLDTFGTSLIENLKQNNVDTRHILRVDSAATGSAVILVDSRGENSIVLSAGANRRLTTHDIELSSLTGAKLLLLQLEVPLEAVLHAARLAKKQNVRVILNPAPAREIPDELLQLADFIVPNETEMALLTGKKIDDEPSLVAAARSLIKRSGSNVIVTLGAKGALIVTRQGRQHVRSFKVKSVDTTGAGDAFIGGLAYALLHRKPLKDAVKYGCACGALATTKFGAQLSLPTAAEVKSLLLTA